MSAEYDFTIPGKAGLFFSCEELNEAGWLVEHAARAALEHCCAYCGQSACYGYGTSLTSDGVWACADTSCRALAEGQAHDDAWARRVIDTPPAKPLSPASHKAPDLFGEAA